MQALSSTRFTSPSSINPTDHPHLAPAIHSFINSEPPSFRSSFLMADRDRDRDRQQFQLHPQQQQQYRYEGGIKNILPQKGPSTSQIVAIVTLLPVSGTLLALAGITLAGSLIGLAFATPVFLIFSPVLVPAAILIAGAVTAFLTSGAFGLTGLSSLSWVLNSFRQATGQEPQEYAKRRVLEATAQVGEKTRQVGETIKAKGQEGVGREGRESGAAVGAGRPA